MLYVRVHYKDRTEWIAIRDSAPLNYMERYSDAIAVEIIGYQP